MDGLPIHTEGKTDNRKTMIAFSSDDFSTPSESRICDIGREINQSEHSSSLTAVQSWFNSPNLGG